MPIDNDVFWHRHWNSRLMIYRTRSNSKLTKIWWSKRLRKNIFFRFHSSICFERFSYVGTRPYWTSFLKRRAPSFLWNKIKKFVHCQSSLLNLYIYWGCWIYWINNLQILLYLPVSSQDKIIADITKQVYNGPRVVKFISAKGKKNLVKNDFWTKTNKKNA